RVPRRAPPRPDVSHHLDRAEGPGGAWGEAILRAGVPLRPAPPGRLRAGPGARERRHREVAPGPLALREYSPGAEPARASRSEGRYQSLGRAPPGFVPGRRERRP